MAHNQTRRVPGPGRRGRRQGGFTLIEVVIVVVIVGILMAIALPGFQGSMQKGRRADAKAGLMDAANRQERFMLDRSTYTTNLQDLGLGAAPVRTEEGHYTLTAAACASGTIANCYVLTATPVAGGAQADDAACTSFILNSSGTKTATGTANTECW